MLQLTVDSGVFNGEKPAELDFVAQGVFYSIRMLELTKLLRESYSFTNVFRSCLFADLSDLSLVSAPSDHMNML